MTHEPSAPNPTPSIRVLRSLFGSVRILYDTAYTPTRQRTKRKPQPRCFFGGRPTARPSRSPSAVGRQSPRTRLRHILYTEVRYRSQSRTSPPHPIASLASVLAVIPSSILDLPRAIRVRHRTVIAEGATRVPHVVAATCRRTDFALGPVATSVSVLAGVARARWSLALVGAYVVRALAPVAASSSSPQEAPAHATGKARASIVILRDFAETPTAA